MIDLEQAIFPCVHVTKVNNSVWINQNVKKKKSLYWYNSEDVQLHTNTCFVSQNILSKRRHTFFITKNETNVIFLLDYYTEILVMSLL